MNTINLNTIGERPIKQIRESGFSGSSGLRLIEQTTNDTMVKLQHNAMHVWSEPVFVLYLSFDPAPLGELPIYAAQFPCPTKGVVISNIVWSGEDQFPSFRDEGCTYTVWVINGIGYISKSPSTVTLQATYNTGTNTINFASSLTAMRINGERVAITDTITIDDPNTVVEFDLLSTSTVNFRGNDKLRSIEAVRGGMTTRYLGGMFHGCTSLESFDFTKFFASFEFDTMYEMFYNCVNLTSVRLSGSTTSTNKMFYGCTNLTNIDILNLSGQVEDMNGMFYDCNNLETIDLSNVEVENVKNMGYMFYQCYKLKNIDLSNIHIPDITSLNATFNNCYSLQSVIFGEGDMSKLENVNYLFRECDSLTEVSFANIESFSQSVNATRMFSGVTSSGELIYNSNADFSNVIAALPATWTSRAV